MKPDEELLQSSPQGVACEPAERNGEVDGMDDVMLDESSPQGIPMRRESAELGLGLLEDIELDATLQFGSRDMVLREVLELGPGDVIELDRHVSEPVDLVVGDRIVARGEVVVANGNFALRITEVATPQLRLESIRCLF